MTRTSQWLAALAFSLALPMTAIAAPEVEPESDKKAGSAQEAKAPPASGKTRKRPIPPQSRTTAPVHPMAEKLRGQMDRSLKKSGMISVHAKRMEKTIRRTAATRLFADALRRKISQATNVNKETLPLLKRALARAEEESRPVQERRKNHKKAQSELLLTAGFAPDRQLSGKLVGQIKDHNREIAMLNRILFVAANQNDYSTLARAEKLLERKNTEFVTFLSDSAKTDAPKVPAKAAK